jgi:hypothetical protein
MAKSGFLSPVRLPFRPSCVIDGQRLKEPEIFLPAFFRLVEQKETE